MLQTLNLNLSLQININKDGEATVTVTPDMPAVVKPVVDMLPSDNTRKSKTVEPQEPVAKTKEREDTITKLANEMDTMVDVVELPKVTIPNPQPSPLADVPPPPVKKDVDMAKLAEEHVSNPLFNVPSDDELRAMGMTAEQYFNSPDYKVWKAPQLGNVPVPERGVDPDADDVVVEEIQDTLPKRATPQPRGAFRERMKAQYAPDEYAKMEKMVEDFEFDNDNLYLPRNPEEKAQMTPEQLAIAETILAERRAKEQQQEMADMAKAFTSPTPPPPPPPVAPVNNGFVPPPPPPVAPKAEPVPMPTPMTQPVQTEQVMDSAAVTRVNNIQRTAASIFGS